MSMKAKRVYESLENILKPKSNQEIESINQKLIHAKKVINSIDPRIIAVSPAEYGEMYPNQADDFQNGNYLIVMDNEDEEVEGVGVLGGAYDVTLRPDLQIQAEWMPYPEEPIIGLDNFVKNLKDQIDRVDDMKNYE